MGHAIQNLSFDEKDSRKTIQAECDEWGNYNADLQERGGCLCGLGSPVRFTDKVFDSYEDAEDYLDRTPSYAQTAVKYKVYPKTTPTKTITELQRRINEYESRVRELNEPHYKGVKSATIKCKKCGSALATAYCGKSWYNSCPICRAELRPQSTIDKIHKYNETLDELRKKLKAEVKKENQKNEKKVRLRWLVHCEVHC